MIYTKNNNVNDYFLLSELCNDDIIFVSKLINLFDSPINKQTIKSLENLKISRYEKTITMILDSLQLNTIANLQQAFNNNADADND